MDRTNARAVGSEAASSSDLRCLLLTPSDPVSRGPRTAAVLRYLHPPPNVKYTLETDRFTYPRMLGYYDMNPATLGLAAFRFLLEHALPERNPGQQLAHSFFWDLRGFGVPWVHESDQSLGQFLSGYTNIRGLIREKILDVFAMYLNSSRCRGAVTWTEWAREGFIEDGIEPSKVSVIPPPFESIYDRREHKGFNVLFLGRDFRRKGGASALASFATLSRDTVCSLTYVGRVEDPNAMKLMRDNRQVVHLENPTSRILREEVWPITDALLLPTNNDAFAIAVVDAMRRGIPAVASSLPPISQVVEDKVSGLLVPQGDTSGFARALQSLADSPGLRAKIGDAARKRASELFSPAKVGTALAGVYT